MICVALWLIWTYHMWDVWLHGRMCGTSLVLSGMCQWLFGCCMWHAVCLNLTCVPALPARCCFVCCSQMEACYRVAAQFNLTGALPFILLPSFLRAGVDWHRSCYLGWFAGWCVPASLLLMLQEAFSCTWQGLFMIRRPPTSTHHIRQRVPGTPMSPKTACIFHMHNVRKAPRAYVRAGKRETRREMGRVSRR